MEPSDEALCQRVAGREEAAFDLLVARYQQRAYRIAWSILGDAEEARDLSQEAFVRLYQSAGTFDGRARFSTWFYRIVVNVCLDHRRRHRRWRWIFTGAGSADESEESIVERLPAPAHDPTDTLARERELKRLWAAVEALASQQRATLLLLAKEELPPKEIATVLKCSEATVRVHLHRALATLRKRLGRN